MAREKVNSILFQIAMLHKREVFILLALFIAAIIGVGWIMLRDPINPWTASKVHVGMSEAEVKALFGRPADNEYRNWDFAGFFHFAPGSSKSWVKFWRGEQWIVQVNFEQNDTVINSGILNTEAFGNSPNKVSRVLWGLFGW